MTNALTPAQQIKGTLIAMTPQFEAILPENVSVKKFMQTLNVAILNDKNLLNKDRASLFKACLELASMGLSANKVDAVLISFSNTVQAMPMVGGLLRLIRESGEVKTIFAELVFKNDVFEYSIGVEGIHFKHQPNVFGDRGERVGAYAYALKTDGTPIVEILTNEDILAIKKCSRGGGNGPWATFEASMIKKACLKRISKKLSLTPAANAAVGDADKYYELDKPAPRDVLNEAPKLESLEDKMGIEKEPAPVVEIIGEETKVTVVTNGEVL